MHSASFCSVGPARADKFRYSTSQLQGELGVIILVPPLHELDVVRRSHQAYSADSPQEAEKSQSRNDVSVGRGRWRKKHSCQFRYAGRGDLAQEISTMSDVDER
jgi:hypothetical protein